jgi:DNA polymerase III subunit chi
MTRVDVHAGAADKLQFACRLLRKSQAVGARVVVGGDPATLDRLDVALWTFDPLSFVAHARVRAGTSGALPASAERAPVWLADEPLRCVHREVLLNLGSELVQGWGEFARVVDVVQAGEPDTSLGRRRWKAYGERPGVERVHHAVKDDA